MEQISRKGASFNTELIGLSYRTWIVRIHKELRTMARELTSSQNPQQGKNLKLAVFFNKHVSPWDTFDGLMDSLDRMGNSLPWVITDGKIALVKNVTPENDLLIGYFIDHEILRMLCEGKPPICPLRKSPQFSRCRVCPGEIFGEINRYCPHITKWIPNVKTTT